MPGNGVQQKPPEVITIAKFVYYCANNTILLDELVFDFTDLKRKQFQLISVGR